MKSAATLLAVTAVASIASVATANGLLSYGAPIQATVWTAGSTQTVSWTNDCSDLPKTTFPIVLQQEQGTVQVPVPGLAPLGNLDCSSSGSIDVQVPATLPSGNTYSILVVNGDVQSYSAHFTINNPNAPASTSAPAVTTTSGAPSSVSNTASASSLPTVKTNGTAIPTVTSTAGAKPTNGAGALKAGSTAALVVVAAVGLML
ncbi:hypothetical protein BGZ83_008687 [Gryganskiella cystojenkinii]|nr:hypothetical protein BGZ83_008687 [Gryganskiella cystojenkinii]